jgi:hypothetical protein
MWSGFWGVDGQYDIVRATFADGTKCRGSAAARRRRRLLPQC